jgi:hypothetical protein
MAISDLWNLMSALAPKMSGITPRADIDQSLSHVRLGPQGDIIRAAATRDDRFVTGFCDRYGFGQSKLFI